jgi:DNA excision repair protein ERCC-6
MNVFALVFPELFVFIDFSQTLPVFQAEFATPINIAGYANASNFQVQAGYKCACMLRDLIQPYLLRRMKKDVAQDLPNKVEQVLFCRLTEKQTQLYRECLKSKEVVDILDGKRNALFGIDLLRKICNHPSLVHSELTPNPEFSGKLMIVKELLQGWKKHHHKVLLFSQTRQMLNIIEKMTQNEGNTSILRVPGGCYNSLILYYTWALIAIVTHVRCHFM